MARAQPARHGGSPVYLALFNLIVGCFSFVGIIVLISVGYWLGPVWNFTLLACLIASLAHVVVVAQGVCRPEREARRVQARVANAVFAITALMAIAMSLMRATYTAASRMGASASAALASASRPVRIATASCEPALSEAAPPFNIIR